MNKYILCSRMSQTYNAGSKAVIDATKIALECGYKKFYYSMSFFSYNKSIFQRNINTIMNVLLCWIGRFRISRYDTYFIQWPISGRSVKILFDAILEKRPNIVILIHDLDDLRGIIYPEDLKYMYDMFKLAETLIVHSDMMRDFLIKKGIESSKIKVLYTFDYLIDGKTPERRLSNKIVFAGNLSKSTFLQDAFFSSGRIQLYAYGLGAENLRPDIEYKGIFSPNDVSQIEGSWGLVWDGSSVYSCAGDFGEYLKYNSPHKVSLYIVSGLPLIIWRHQALAKYIEEKKIGICINSLEEIPHKIAQISEIEYKNMVACVKNEAEILLAGGHLKQFLY